MEALNQRLPTFARPTPTATAPAQAIWREPSVAERVVRGASITSAVVIDGAFGSVWSTREFTEAHRKLADLSSQDAMLRNGPLLDAPGASATHWRTLAKNSQAMLLRNRYDRHQQHVRRTLHGATAGAGGLAYGLGWCLNPSVLGLGHFAGYPAAVTVASTALLWVGAPLLSVAALGVAVYEGVRLHRHEQVRRLFDKVCKNPVVGHEAEVYELLIHRANQVRWHSGMKIASMIGLAVGAPLLAVGFAPGAAVLTPAGVGAGWASYYLHTRLMFKPQLEPMELLQLRRRDLMNRIVLAHHEYSCLKELKQSKRLLYPRGGQGLLGPVARAAGGVRRYFHGPTGYEEAHATVARYLHAQVAAEEAFIAAQQQLHAYAASKNPNDLQHRGELARLDGDLANAQAQMRAEALPGDADDPVDAAIVASAFAQHVQRHQLEEALLAAAQRDPARKTLKAHGILVTAEDTDTTSLDLQALQGLCAVSSPLSPDDRTVLAEAFAGFAERFLLTGHKQNTRYLRDQLLDFLAYRLQASAGAGYPNAREEDQADDAGTQEADTNGPVTREQPYAGMQEADTDGPVTREQPYAGIREAGTREAGTESAAA